MWDKSKQALPAAGLLAAAVFFGVLSVAASFRLSIRLLEKSLQPVGAAFAVAAGYGMAAGVVGALGNPPLPAETARETVKTAADNVGAASG